MNMHPPVSVLLTLISWILTLSQGKVGGWLSVTALGQRAMPVSTAGEDDMEAVTERTYNRQPELETQSHQCGLKVIMIETLGTVKHL